ncbi:hypothetical protein ACFUAC_28475 [Streptomyces sp. NPDC057148]|uniref:hypothetical protein n=1 Tax=unclassified Streptomyces TaxID=2593676 RepID=UPI00363424D7
MDGHDERSRPEVGSLAKDTATGRVGVVRDRVGGRVQMQPLNGGREWEAMPAKVEPLTAREELTVRNEARNKLTRNGALTKAGK